MVMGIEMAMAMVVVMGIEMATVMVMVMVMAAEHVQEWPWFDLGDIFMASLILVTLDGELGVAGSSRCGGFGRARDGPLSDENDRLGRWPPLLAMLLCPDRCQNGEL